MTVTDEELATLGDWDHYLPQAEWDRVKERAETIARERFAVAPLEGARGFVPQDLTPRYIDFPNSPNDKSGTLRRKQLWVIHTAECPLEVGYAQSLTEWADGDSYSPRVSWHRFIDPATVARFISLAEAAWHASIANGISIGFEQAGYAAYSRAKWLTVRGLRQISLLAEELVRCGIPKEAVRVLTRTQVQAALNGDTSIKGLCSHANINPAQRTDPGAGYPWDVLVDYVKWFHPGFDVPAPAPTPTPPPVLSPTDPNWSDKMTRDDLKAALREVLREKDTARWLFTGHPIMDDPKNPDPAAPRVAPSHVMETSAVASLEAAKNTRPSA